VTTVDLSWKLRAQKAEANVRRLIAAIYNDNSSNTLAAIAAEIESVAPQGEATPTPEPTLESVAYWKTRAETAELKVLTFHEEIVKLRGERERGMPDADGLIRGIVQASIELVCIRHELCFEDSPPLVVEQVAELVEDVFNALRGIDTCDPEPCPEYSALKAQLGRGADGWERGVEEAAKEKKCQDRGAS
jgi:hypothetical protein